MERKATWMLYLIIGISLALISCDDEDCKCVNARKDYIYHNLSDHDLEIRSYGNIGDLLATYNLGTMDSIIIRGRVPFDFIETTGEDIIADSLIFVFDSEKYLNVLRDVDSIFLESSYRLSENGKTLIFDIANSYYERAE